MPLAPGTRLGPYEITAAIGAGGMGEVFRGHDASLNRDAAIKVLPSAMAADPERLARFKREAQVLASLSHPNIASVYGFEAATLPDGSTAHFLAMEMVAGEDLSERLKRGAIPVDDAIAIAKQIAEGLEDAHEHGIIHRDLKPANIKVAADGKVKILDFGLAKAFESDPSSSTANSQLSHSPTMSRHMTEAGMIMGTAAYMSPEQARGKPVDKRTDIWAFGVVLFEMLTGTRLFAGETVSDVLVAVLTRDPDLNLLPPGTPRAVHDVIRRCLERDLRKRLHDIADARILIEEATATPADAGGRADPTPAKASRLPWVLAGVLALVLAGTWARSLFAPISETPVTRLRIQLAPKEPLGAQLGANAVLSPDGRTVAMVIQSAGRTELSIRQLDKLEATPLSGTDDGRSPFFSPDGRWIGFDAKAGLMKIGLAGGAPVTLTEAYQDPGRGATWGGNQIVFGRTNSGLFKVPDSGGTPAPLTALDEARAERSHRWPSFLPGGKTVVFMVQHLGQDYDDGDIEAVSIADGRRTMLVQGGAFPRYAPGGYLLYVRDHVLYGLRFDPERLTVEEPATPLIEGLMGLTGDEVNGDGSAEFSLSDHGDLLYREGEIGSASPGTDFVWLDEKGQETPAFHAPIFVTQVEISPDGQRVAIVGRSARGSGVFIKDLARGTFTPLTTDGAGDDRPVWSPDGRRLAYAPRGSANPRVVVRTLDGSAPERDLPVPGVTGASPISWLPDGSALVVGSFQPGTLNDILLLPLDGGDSRPLTDSPANEGQGQVSPDGRWLAFRSDEKGQSQIFITSVGTPGPHFQVSERGGTVPRWSRDGRSLYFSEERDFANQFGALMVISVDTDGQTPRFGPPRLVSTLPQRTSRPDYDVHPDGRLLSIKRSAAATEDIDAAHAILVTGWREELARLMGKRK